MQIDIGTALTILGIILGIIGALLGVIMKMAFNKIAELEKNVEKLEIDIKDVKKEVVDNDKAQTSKTNDIDVTVAGFGQNYITKSEFMFWQQQQSKNQK